MSGRRDESSELASRLRAAAIGLGFELVGVCRPEPSELAVQGYRSWVAAGMAGEMGYMARPDRLAKACRPTATLAHMRSMVVVGKNYHSGDLPAAVRGDPSRGLIAAIVTSSLAYAAWLA